MTDEHESAWGAGSPDAELIAAVRLGDTEAFGVLYQRHATAARTVAGQYLRSPGEADDAVADAFTKVLAILSGGGGPDIAFRAYLFTVVRRLAYEMVNGSRRTQPTDDMAAFESALGPLASTEEPALQGFERTTVAQAFRSLPERWQSVLWYSEVEGLAPAAIAPILGLTANGAAALSYRAREGLREAYLQQHLSSVPADECQRANALLGSFVRGGLAKRETAVVEHHLEDCGECRALVLELGDVSHGMRAVIAPLVLGLAGAGLVGTALPTWGAAAGATTATGLASTGLAAGPAGASSGGSGAGASGGSAGGSSAGAGGSAAAGGTAAGGAATGAATAGGLAAMVAAAPALVLGIAAVVVVAAGLGVAALLGVVGGDDEPVADPGSSTSADTQDDDTNSPDAGDDADDGADEPSADPTDPTTVPTLPDGTDADDGTAIEPGTDDGTSSTTPRPTTPQPTTPTVPPTVTPEDTAPAPVVPTPVDPAPVDPPPVDPAPVDPTPVDPTPVDPAPPSVSLDLGADLTLIPGQNNSLQLSLNNTGLSVVADVGLVLSLPVGLAFVPDGSTAGGVFGPRMATVQSGGWTCLATGAVDAQGASTVRCDLGEMGPGLADPLTLDVYAERGAGSVPITAQVYIGDDPVGELRRMPYTFLPEPPRLDVGVAPVAELVAGRPGHLAVSVSNLGEVSAASVNVEIPLPEASGVTWRAAGAGLQPAPGSTGGWTCSVTGASAGPVADCTSSAEIVGDASSTVVLPVAVLPGSVFDGKVLPVVGHGGVPGVPGTPLPLTVAPRGLSAVALFDGPLQTAQIAGALSEAAVLRVPAGATVRHAELVWSGSGGDPDAEAAGLELRGDTGAPASLSLAGTPVTLDPAGSGSGGPAYWAASDVTALLAAHPGSGRWTVATVTDGKKPTDLRWTLTIVYDVAGQPLSSVAVLSGPPATGVASLDRTLLLPADGPVKVAATAVGEGGTPPSLLANGVELPAVGGTGVVTYRSTTVLAPTSAAPLALSLSVPTGGPGAVDALVLHSSAEPSAAGPLDQTEGAVGPTIVLDPVEPLVDGGSLLYRVSLHNDNAFALAEATVTFDLTKAGLALSGSGCRLAHSTVSCLVTSVDAEHHIDLPLLLLATQSAIDSGRLTYSVAGTDPLTGASFESHGVVVRAHG